MADKKKTDKPDDVELISVQEQVPEVKEEPVVLITNDTPKVRNIHKIPPRKPMPYFLPPKTG